MKRKIIIYTSIIVFLTAITLSSIKEIQHKEYADAGIPQSKGVEADATTNPFLYLPVDW